MPGLPITWPVIWALLFTEVGDDYLKATMPLSDLTSQHMGIMHGGANVVYWQRQSPISLEPYAAKKGRPVVGLDINANHIRPGKSTGNGNHQTITHRPNYHGLGSENLRCSKTN